MKIFDLFAKKNNQEKDSKGKKQILVLTYLFASLFLMLIVYIILFNFESAPVVINNSYNKREDLFKKRNVKGEILSRDYEVLARSVNVGTDNEKREYPYGKLFAHVVGYNTYGKMGLENRYNFTMLNSDVLITERIKNSIKGRKNSGDSIVTTLDMNMQKAAYDALGDYKGSVIAMNAKTGEILALVSKPCFDPNDVDNLWDTLKVDKNSPLLNRAVQGLYPPGSTFKIVTALEYIRENDDVDNYKFNCEGSYVYDDIKINCYHGMQHGEVDFDLAFAKSCNSAFANMTGMLEDYKFNSTCESLLFGKDLPCPFTCKKSFSPVKKGSDSDEIIQAGIGQGTTEVTPYHMCLITAAIANDGVLMEPRIVSDVVTANNDIVRSYKSKKYRKLLSVEEAKQLQDLMRLVVTEGTATRIKDTNGYVAYGKTGSAEYSNDKSRSHAWFTCYGDFGDDKIVVTVIAEDAGSGGQIAVPIAKKVLDVYNKR